MRERRTEEKRHKRRARDNSRPFEALYVKVYSLERSLLYWLQENRLEVWLGRVALSVTSGNPFQDICIVTSVSAIAALFSIGFPFFWMLAYSTASYFVINFFLRCPRPQVLDQRIVPLCRTSEDVVCQEAFFAVIVFGTLGLYPTDEGTGAGEPGTDLVFGFDWAYVVQQLLLLALAVFLSWTRLVACSKSVLISVISRS